MSVDCSTCSESSNSTNSTNYTNDSLNTSDFNAQELLSVIQVLLLPANTREPNLQILDWKDNEIIELIERLNEFFFLEKRQLQCDYSLIIDFVNKNRKCLRKRKVRLNKLKDQELKHSIEAGLKELNN